MFRILLKDFRKKYIYSYQIQLYHLFFTIVSSIFSQALQ
ncbi:hypothetical protein SD77_2702 [Bacillus badius]|uniref:ABC transporter permease n=1 Tax=Bacillus badius TaxID=1455 RepID=A0ABR5APT7_BACBA|nr:hypothetical protein SD78_4427 [Bacillus badius]KIL75862.1 hypothetical protein SD77_2702 [Bacillus badius]